MTTLTANELKRSGVSAIERAMVENGEHQVMIDVRGITKFVVLDIEEYNAFREYELDKAIKQAEACYGQGRFDTITNFDSFADDLRKEIDSDA